MAPSAAQITVSTRKELYGRRVRRWDNDTQQVARAIVVDSHFIADEGPHHPMRIILVVEDEPTGLLMVWEVPGKIKSPADWGNYNYRITFDKLDVDMTDIAHLGLDTEPTGLLDLVGAYNQKQARGF